jgi:hypothetical protein
MPFHSSRHTGNATVGRPTEMRYSFRKFQSGGDSATGLTGNKVRNNKREESCAQNGKWITSLTAIVASLKVMVVRGALVLKRRRVPLLYLARFFLFLRAPLPQ